MNRIAGVLILAMLLAAFGVGVVDIASDDINNPINILNSSESDEKLSKQTRQDRDVEGAGEGSARAPRKG